MAARNRVKVGSKKPGNKKGHEEKELGFRFSPHFHPYAGELLKRLLVPSPGQLDGIPTLQAADTAFADKLVLLRNPNDQTATLPMVTPVKLVGGRYAILPHGARVRLRDGSVERLSQDFLEKHGPGTEFTALDAVNAGLVNFNPELNPPPLQPVSLLALAAGAKAVLVGWKQRPELYGTIFSWTNYRPSDLVVPPYPAKDLDFETIGPASAYSVYNWELFYHIPIAVAIHLSRNQRFEEAKKWFQYVFNPEDDSDGPTPERFWKVKPLQTTDIKSIEAILINLSTNEDATLRLNTIECIRKWMEKPFRPHLVARFRHTAYMYKAVMAYLDNLIAWGDSLFRQDRPESVDDAADRYIEARGILGERPQAVPKKGTAGPSTYAKLKRYSAARGGFDAFGNVLTELESDLPFADVTSGGSPAPGMRGLEGIGREALYFCVPRNDRLLAYWDIVEDRLYKIHNSLNIMGVFRELPLFEPPIDPGLLAKGVAAGLDVSAIAEGLNQPLVHVRFQFLFQKASEICQEARALGDKLLSVMEKEDGEALSILRARHETVMLEMTEMVKYSQWQEALKSMEGLEKSYENAVNRFTYFEQQLGEKDIQTPKLAELESPAAGLEKLKFTSREPVLGARAIDIDISDDAGGATGGKIKTLSSYEVEELEKLAEAQTTQDLAGVLDAIAGVIRVIPEIFTDIKPFGVGAGLSIGGEDIAAVLQIASGISKSVGARLGYEAGRTAKIGAYARREQDWVNQRNAAAGEINQIIKQYVAAMIRSAIAEKEWKNHKKQIEQAQRIEEFLTNERNGKKTNQALYTWMKREVKGLYSQCFRFALETAQKAERALQHELGDRNLTILQPGYLSGKEGFLSGDRLHADLRRMEMVYHLSVAEQNMGMDVSLLQVDPLALVRLRATGKCSFSIPEEYFDLVSPGFYFRRIHSVSVSVPCVAGPYSGVNCTLSLGRNTIRKTSLIGDGYARAEGSDERFEDNFDQESIVAAKAQNDSGRFQADRSARDESRRQPFMGKGVISQWQIELPADPSKKDPALFDYDTISDVILHIQYTAREGGRPLRDKAMENLKARIEAATMAGSNRLFSVRHEFPVEWHKLMSAPPMDGRFKMDIRLEQPHYPYWTRNRIDAVRGIEVFAKGVANRTAIYETSTGLEIGALERKNPALGGIYSARLENDKPAAFDQPVGRTLTLYFEGRAFSDLWIAITSGKA